MCGTRKRSYEICDSATTTDRENETYKKWLISLNVTKGAVYANFIYTHWIENYSEFVHKFISHWILNKVNIFFVFSFDDVVRNVGPYGATVQRTRYIKMFVWAVYWYWIKLRRFNYIFGAYKRKICTHEKNLYMAWWAMPYKAPHLPFIFIFIIK